jgi:hypothetical protein
VIHEPDAGASSFTGPASATDPPLLIVIIVGFTFKGLVWIAMIGMCSCSPPPLSQMVKRGSLRK